MGSRVLTACSFRSKSIPQQVFHRCRSAEALRLFRVPAVYLTSAFLWFLSILLFRRINNLSYALSMGLRGANPTRPPILQPRRRPPTAKESGVVHRKVHNSGVYDCL